MYLLSFTACHLFRVFSRVQQVYAYTGRHGCQRGIRVAESGCDNSDCKSINTGFPKYPCAANMGRMSSFIAGSSSCICPARAISKIPRHKNRRFSGIKENP